MEDLRYYIDGPGEVLVTTSDFSFTTPDKDKILCLISCKSVKVSGTQTQESVTGGRSLFPKRKYKTEQTATVEITDCEMDFRYLAISQGEDIVEGAAAVNAFGDDYLFTVDATDGTIYLGHAPIANTLVLKFVETGEVSVFSATPTTTDYSLSGATVTFGADAKGLEVQAIFQYTGPATMQRVSTLVDSIPKTLRLVHKQPTFDADNNITGYQYIEFFKVQASGEFEEAFEEKAAYAPVLSFELLDPRRSDKKVFEHSWVPV